MTHPATPALLHDLRQGHLSRREFLTRATALGLSLPLAESLTTGAAIAQVPPGQIPAAAPAPQQPTRGGSLRMAMELRPLEDPRLAASSQITNITRGWLEYLVEYQPEGGLRGMLLDRWEVDATAQHYRLHLRPGIRWSNGDALTARDLVYNFARWCDATVPGNAMSGRMRALQDADGRQLRPDALQLEGDLTLALTLSRPDCTLMATLADYPAAVVHPSYTAGDPALSPGTGPYRLESFSPGASATLLRDDRRPWWGTLLYGGPWLDRIDYVDLGADPGAELRAARAGQIDATAQSVGQYIDEFSRLGWPASQVESAATLAVRFRLDDPVFANPAVRRALTLCINNAVVLELGHDNRGQIAENHHVSRLHPDYFPLPSQEPDPKEGARLLREARMADHVFELVSVDDAWQAASCDAVAAQLTDAGVKVRRRLVPSAEFWQNWRSYAFSATEWNMRPLGVQMLDLAYRSGTPWNETRFADPEFDALLDQALALSDTEARRAVMRRLEQILQQAAVMVQPYWRRLYRNAAPQVRDCQIHPMFEHHHYRWWIAPRAEAGGVGTDRAGANGIGANGTGPAATPLATPRADTPPAAP